MKVAVFGGTGFIGSYLIDELVTHGHSPVVLVRRGSELRLRQNEYCKKVYGDIKDAGAVHDTVAGCDAIIYNIGILREFPSEGISFRALHYEGAKRVMESAESEGVKRFLLMSANGASADGTEYQKTKFMGEEYLRCTDLAWTIVKPSVVFGDPRGKTEFATQLYNDVIRPPLPAPLFYDGVLPIDAGAFAMSPVHVRDLTTIFVKSLEMPEAIKQTYLVGGEDLEWRGILKTISQAVGTTKLTVPVPVWALTPLATLMDRYAFFPITRDQLVMLLNGNTCDSTQVFKTFGLVPVRFTADSLSYLKGE